MKKNTNTELISKTFFRLLPIQILLALVSAVNGAISGIFGSNFVGATVMSAIGLYGPITMFLMAASMVFVGGSQILCGKYMGKNEPEKTQDIFKLSLLTVTGFSVVTCIILLLSVFTNLTRVFTSDPVTRDTLNKYILGQVIGTLPLMLGQLLPAERLEIFDPKDKMKNEGIRMVYKGAKDIRYQNILGLNVLTIYI